MTDQERRLAYEGAVARSAATPLHLGFFLWSIGALALGIAIGELLRILTGKGGLIL